VRDISGNVKLVKLLNSANDSKLIIELPSKISSGLYIVSGQRRNGELVFNKKLVVTN